jgi:hypothetical protein
VTKTTGRQHQQQALRPVALTTTTILDRWQVGQQPLQQQQAQHGHARVAGDVGSQPGGGAAKLHWDEDETA